VFYTWLILATSVSCFSNIMPQEDSCTQSYLLKKTSNIMLQVHSCTQSYLLKKNTIVEIYNYGFFVYLIFKYSASGALHIILALYLSSGRHRTVGSACQNCILAPQDLNSYIINCNFLQSFTILTQKYLWECKIQYVQVL